MNTSLMNNPKLQALSQEMGLPQAPKATGQRRSIKSLVREYDMLSTFSARTATQVARMAEIERELTKRMAHKNVSFQEVLNTANVRGIVHVR